MASPPRVPRDDLPSEHEVDELYHRLLLSDPSISFSGESGTSESLDGEAYRLILLQIVRGTLPGGSVLKTTQLARDLGLSRTPVRQALAALAADGIVERRKNQRAVVRAGAENWLVQIHELRLLLEPAAAARAAAALPEEVLIYLDELGRAALPDASDDWMVTARQFDYALHLSIADYAGNLPLREMIRKCWSFKRLSYEAGQDRAAALARGYHEHQAILAALRDRNGPAAQAAMQLHLHSAAHCRPAERIV